MKRSFAALMKLYPPGYRALFADEMAAVFEEACRDHRAQGQLAYILYLLTEFAGLIKGAVLARSLGVWQNRAVRLTIPFVAGTLISVAFLPPLLAARRFLTVANSHLNSQDDTLKLLVLATASIIVIAGCSVAFVLNLRSIARRIEHPSKT